MDLLGIDPSFFDYRLAKLDPTIVTLLPFTVRLTYKAKKFQFVETSALGINVTTPFGPRSNVPVLKQDVLGMLAHSSIPAYVDLHVLASCAKCFKHKYVYLCITYECIICNCGC
jgi:hypothetical protein